jgi:hypothetical protein
MNPIYYFNLVEKFGLKRHSPYQNLHISGYGLEMYVSEA